MQTTCLAQHSPEILCKVVFTKISNNNWRTRNRRITLKILWKIFYTFSLNSTLALIKSKINYTAKTKIMHYTIKKH